MSSTNHNPATDRFLDKWVVLRGIGSGVVLGRPVAIHGIEVLLEPGAYFCASWSFDNTKAHGSFHSLANGLITEGVFSKMLHETIVTDVAQMIIATEECVKIVKKFETL